MNTGRLKSSGCKESVAEISPTGVWSAPWSLGYCFTEQMTASDSTNRKNIAAESGDAEPPTPSCEEEVALLDLVNGLVWHACAPEYAAKVGPHEYVVRHKTCPEESWAALQEAIQRYGRRERYLVTGNIFTYLVLGEHRYWTAPGWNVINRARQADIAGKYGPAEKQSKPLRLNLGFHETQVIDLDTGEVYAVAAAAARIPWVKFRGETVPPTMPAHWYVVQGRCGEIDWNVLAFAIAEHPESYLAYFRGYHTPNRYLELGDGYRYWRTKLHGTHMLNRCTLDSCEPPRRVDQGARPETDWQGPPWWPKDLPWSEEYERQLVDTAYGRQSPNSRS